MALPRLFGLKHEDNGKYMRYSKEGGKTHGLISFSGAEIVNPCAKFEFVMGKSGTGTEQMHIRCGYNNKYLARSSQYSYWISAAADEPEDDKSKLSCTLFEPRISGTHIELCHVQLGNYAFLWEEPSSPYHHFLSISTMREGRRSFTLTDWESLLILPKHVAFKGDNGQYLGQARVEGHPYLLFNVCDKGLPNVAQEIFTNPDGSVRIRCHQNGKFWRRSPNWIWADSDNTGTGNKDTLFFPTRVDHNVVALRNLGNNTYCTRLTTEGKTSALNANATTINSWARLQIEELVISRSIYNVSFHFDDARIYGQQKVVLGASQEVTNRSNQSTTTSMRFSHSVTTVKTWNDSVSLKLGVKTTLQTGVPCIVDGKIEISAEFTGSYEWGGSIRETNTLESTYTVTVPPMSRMKVSMVATKGKCDIPFSYTQRDTLMDGKVVILNMDDGLYTGVNYHNTTFDTTTPHSTANQESSERPTVNCAII